MKEVGLLLNGGPLPPSLVAPFLACKDGHHLPVMLGDVVVVILAVCAVGGCGVALEEQLAAISATTGARATFETSFPISRGRFTADSRASY